MRGHEDLEALGASVVRGRARYRIGVTVGAGGGAERDSVGAGRDGTERRGAA